MSDDLKTMAAAARARADWLDKVTEAYPDAYPHDGRITAGDVRKQAVGVQVSGDHLYVYTLVGEGRVYDPHSVSMLAFFASMHADDDCRKEMVEHAVKLLP